MEWTKAGGQMHNQQRQAEMGKMDRQTQTANQRINSIGTVPSTASQGTGTFVSSTFESRSYGAGGEGDLLTVVTRFISSIFA